MTFPPFVVKAVGEPASILTKGGLLVSKEFYSHQQSWWIYELKHIKDRRRK
jgi:hypothetical protein